MSEATPGGAAPETAAETRVPAGDPDSRALRPEPLNPEGFSAADQRASKFFASYEDFDGDQYLDGGDPVSADTIAAVIIGICWGLALCAACALGVWLTDDFADSLDAEPPAAPADLTDLP